MWKSFTYTGLQIQLQIQVKNMILLRNSILMRSLSNIINNTSKDNNLINRIRNVGIVAHIDAGNFNIFYFTLLQYPNKINKIK